jgi:hypothetical protein
VAAITAFCDWVEAVRPDHIYVAGDFWDLPQVSTHAPDVSQDIAVLPAVRSGVALLNRWADLSRVTFIEGNHEARLFKRLIVPFSYQLRGLENLFSLQAIARAHGLYPSVEWLVESPSGPAPASLGQYQIRHGHNQAGRFGGGRTPAATMLHKDASGTHHSLIMGHFHRPQIYTCGDRTYIVNAHMEAPVDFAGGADGWTRGWTAFYVDGDAAQAVPMWSNTGAYMWEGRTYGAGASRAPAEDTPPPAPERPPETSGEPERVEIEYDSRGHPRVFYGALQGVSLAELARVYGLPPERVRKRWWRREGDPATGDELLDLMGVTDW